MARRLADLRGPRPRRHPLAGEGDRHRQRPRRLHPAPPGPLAPPAPTGRATTPAWPRAGPRCSRACPPPGSRRPIESWEEFEELMETLVSSAAISTVREVWWDIRPHPDFGTVELRMCDGIPTLSEVAAIAALGQCLVSHLDTWLDEGLALPRRTRTGCCARTSGGPAATGSTPRSSSDDDGDVRPLRDVVRDLVERAGAHRRAPRTARASWPGSRASSTAGPATSASGPRWRRALGPGSSVRGGPAGGRAGVGPARRGALVVVSSGQHLATAGPAARPVARDRRDP